jgi:putative addiction module component (TIGR02574 family)
MKRQKKDQGALNRIENLEVRNPPLTDAQRAELDRRLAALNGGATTMKPWTEIEARILKRLKA